jgi:hypothetical protein
MNEPPLERLLERLRGPGPGTPAATVPLRLAGRPVQLRFGSAALAALLTRSIRHLREEGAAPPELTIDCWTDDLGPAAVPPDWNRTGLTYLESAACHLTWEPPEGPLVIYDRARRHAWMRFATVDSVLNWEVARPFRRILHWWGADQSLQLIHAAAVGGKHAGVLLAGPSGSGKSTTALACLAGGFAYAGDDYCLVEPGRPPRVHALYLSGVGNAQTAHLLPTLRERLLSAPRMPAQDSAKHLIYADEVAPAAVTPGFPLRAIVIPQITGGKRSHLHPLSAADALRALAPSTVLQLPGKRAEGLARLGLLVRSVPSWQLRLGEDPRTAVDVLADFLVTPAGSESSLCPS